MVMLQRLLGSTSNNHCLSKPSLCSTHAPPPFVSRGLPLAWVIHQPQRVERPSPAKSRNWHALSPLPRAWLCVVALSWLACGGSSDSSRPSSFERHADPLLT